MKLGNFVVTFDKSEQGTLTVVGKIIQIKENRGFYVLEIGDRIGFVELKKDDSLGEVSDLAFVHELKRVWDLANVTEQLKQNYRG